MDVPTQLLLSVTTGAFVGALSTYMTTHLAFRRFYSERWWERKASSYADALDALYERLDASGRMYILETTKSTDTVSKLLDEEKDRYTKAVEKLDRVIQVGALTMSGRATQTLIDYRTECINLLAEHAWPLNLLHEARHTFGVIARLRDEAKSDLRVDRALQ